MAGCHCSLGVCAGTAYTFAVWFGCFAFILWGCHCDDPERGYPNDWNRIYIAKEKLTDAEYKAVCDEWGTFIAGPTLSPSPSSILLPIPTAPSPCQASSGVSPWSSGIAGPGASSPSTSSPGHLPIFRS